MEMLYFGPEKVFEIRKFSHMQLNKACHLMSARDVRFTSMLDGRCPDIKDTKGRAKAVKSRGHNRYARHIQRSSKRRERRQAKQELASMALA